MSWVLLQQIVLAGLLLLIVNVLGSRTRGLGYVGFRDIPTSGALAFNVFFRVVTPPMYVALLALVGDVFHLTSFVHQVWLVPLFF
jgi:hypothetical protein